MKNSLLKFIKARDEEAIIRAIELDPSILDIKTDSGANNFITLAYYRLEKAFSHACKLKSHFSVVDSIAAGKSEDVIDRISETNANKVSDDGYTYIALATYLGHSGMARQLLYIGADPNIKANNQSKVNALHAAVAREDVALAKLYLQHDADINALQMNDVTALHSAAKRGNILLINLLLAYGADAALHTIDGQSAADSAHEAGHVDVTEALNNAEKTKIPKIIDKVAWIEVSKGRILTTRSKNKSAFYIPGGKRDEGETDQETLIREIKEELSVDILANSIYHMGNYKAQADGHADGIIVKMSCYTADYHGELRAANEIAETAWLSYEESHRSSHVDKVIFDHLRYLNKL